MLEIQIHVQDYHLFSLQSGNWVCPGFLSYPVGKWWTGISQVGPGWTEKPCWISGLAGLDWKPRHNSTWEKPAASPAGHLIECTVNIVTGKRHLQSNMTSLPWAMTTLLKTRRATLNSYRKRQDQNWRCTRAMKSERWRKSGKSKTKTQIPSDCQHVSVVTFTSGPSNSTASFPRLKLTSIVPLMTPYELMGQTIFTFSQISVWLFSCWHGQMTSSVFTKEEEEEKV